MKSTDVIPLTPRDAAQQREGAAARPGLALAAVVLSAHSGIAPETARNHLSAILDSLTPPIAG